MPIENPSWAEAQPKDKHLEANQLAINELRLNIQQNELPNSFSKFFNVRLSQLEKKAGDELTNSELHIAEIEKAVNKLMAIRGILAWDKWLENFWTLLMNLDEPSKQSIVEIFSHNDQDDLVGYFENNGIPNIELTLQFFWRKFWKKMNFISQNERKETNISNLDKANIEKLTEIYSAISDHADTSPVFILLKQLAEWHTQAYSELKHLLLSNPEQLKLLISSVQESDRENQTNHYETLRHTLISVDPVFIWILDELATASSWKDNITLPKAYIYSLSGHSPKLSGSILKSTNNYGDQITIDTSKVPPLRELSLVDSEYAIETNSSIGVLHKPEAEFSQRRDELNTKLKVINALQTKLIQGHITDLMDHGFNLAEIKSQLKLTYQIDIWFIDSIGDLSSPSILESKQKEMEEQLKVVETEYAGAMKLAIEQHRKDVFKEDEKTREVLGFVSGIGFDLIPKEYTDQLISEVKSWLLVINAFEIAPARLNLKDGQFWESPTEEGWDKWKSNLIKFFNTMISWAPDKPLSVEAHLWVSGKSEDRTEMRHQLILSGILTDSGNFNFDKARDNLGAMT